MRASSIHQPLLSVAGYKLKPFIESNAFSSVCEFTFLAFAIIGLGGAHGSGLRSARGSRSFRQRHRS